MIGADSPTLSRLGVIVDGADGRREVKLMVKDLIELANTGRDTKGVLKETIPKEIVPPEAPANVNRLSDSIKRMQEAARLRDAARFAEDLKRLDPFANGAAPPVNRVAEAIRRTQEAARQRDAAKFVEDLAKVDPFANRAAQSVNRYADSIKRMQQASAQKGDAAMSSLISKADPFQNGAAANPFAQIGSSAVAAEKAALNFGRLREGMNGVFNASVQLAPGMSQLLSIMSQMAIGSVLTVGIMAGIAAIAYGWNKLTEDARKMKEATQQAIGTLKDLREQQRLGATASSARAAELAGTSLYFVQEDIATQQQRIRDARHGGYNDPKAERELADLERQQTELRSLIQAHENAVAELRKEKAEERSRVSKEATDKEVAEITRLREAQRDYWEYIGQLQDKKGGGLPGLATVMSSGAQRGAAQDHIQNGKIQVDVSVDLARYGQRMAEAVRESARIAAVVAEVTEKQRQMAGLKQIAIQSGLSLLSTFGGQTGQMVSGVAGAAMQGFAAGGPWGAAIAGGTQLVTSLFSMGRASREAREQLDRTREALKQAVNGTADAIKSQMAATAQQIHAAYDSEIAVLRMVSAIEAANKLEAERNALLEKNAANAKDQIEAQKRLAALDIEDLKSRILRASGLVAEADALELTIKQQREWEQAVRDHKDAAYMATLADTQRAEAERAVAERLLESKRALEDLNARRAIALGQDQDTADNIAFAIQQQREYEDALRAGRDATYLATLAETQKAEATARSIEKVKASIAAFDQTISGLKSFKDQLALSETAGLSPTARLGEARRQYDAVVKAGDANRLPAAAQAFLEFSRQVNASGPAFQSDLARVNSDIDALIKQQEASKSIYEKQLEELVKIRELQKASVDIQSTYIYDSTPRRRFPGRGDADIAANIQATVTVLQAGFLELSEKLDDVGKEVRSVATETRSTRDWLRLQ